MPHLIFVPLSDELIYDHPELICGPVRPFVQDARRVPDDLSCPVPENKLTGRYQGDAGEQHSSDAEIEDATTQSNRSH